MATSSVEPDSYSWRVAFIYVFNLIVGAGALALPKAFAETGWVLGLIALFILALMSYCTSTFMMEAMSIGNAVHRLRKAKHEHVEENSDPVGNHKEVLIPPSEGSPLLINSANIDEDDLYAITTKIEMGELANMFFNKAGMILYYLIISMYLYGDLAIYAAAVPKSLASVVCGGSKNQTLDQPCHRFTNFKEKSIYRIMLVIFTACLCPFVFFNLSKTKFLQLGTTLFRWVAFIVMIVLAFVIILKGHSTHRAEIFDIKKLPSFFGVAVYSFMCQHSLPSIITPVTDKRRINRVLFLDFGLVSGFYILLVMTAVFTFSSKNLKDLYTLNFAIPIVPNFLQYFLELFPVFTLSTSFPIIGITLRENLKTLFLKRDRYYGLFTRRYLFPLITVIPPIAIAFATDDVEFLVSVTGSYAGAVIQYVVPVMLVFYGRIHMRKTLGSYKNQHRSPFRQRSWIFLVIGWYVACVVFVTVNHFM